MNRAPTWDDIAPSYARHRCSVDQGDDFIEVYDDELSAEVCSGLIALFERSASAGHTHPGTTGRPQVDTSAKHSLDLAISQAFLRHADPAWQPLIDAVVTAIFRCATRYFQKYHALLPTAVQRPDGRFVLHEELITNPELAQQVISQGFGLNTLQLQRYRPPGQGYAAWHYEQGEFSALRRLLFPIVYLNDVETGGETEFYHWDRAVAPRAGRILLAPGSFTHTHRMRPGPVSGDKYILTTWLVYKQSA